MTDEENPQDRRNGAPEGLSRLAQIAGKIIAPVTAITALMVYFVWALTSATYGVFGIEDSVLGFSIQDYLLRSINETVKPVVLLLLVVLVAIPIHLGLIKLIRDHGWRRRVIFPLGAVGAVSVLAGLLGFLDVVTYPVAWPLIPMSLGLGALLIGYANSLWRAAIGTQLSPIGGSDVIDIVTRGLVYGVPGHHVVLVASELCANPRCRKCSEDCAAGRVAHQCRRLFAAFFAFRQRGDPGNRADW
jgi:hypothetical protein